MEYGKETTQSIKDITTLEISRETMIKIEKWYDKNYDDLIISTNNIFNKCVIKLEIVDYKIDLFKLLIEDSENVSVEYYSYFKDTSDLQYNCTFLYKYDLKNEECLLKVLGTGQDVARFSEEEFISNIGKLAAVVPVIIMYIEELDFHKVIIENNKSIKKNSESNQDIELKSGVNKELPHFLNISGIGIKYFTSNLNPRKYERSVDSWGVRGHARHLKNGNIIMVKPYKKGDKDKDIQKKNYKFK